jgi:putative photosynthetic complex assembly protein 2
MAELLIAVSFAVFIWWFSTGAILYLDNLAKATFRWSLILFGAIAAAALVCLAKIGSELTTSGAYAGFICAICVWAWVELSFLTGIVTGPNKTAWQPPKSGIKQPKFQRLQMAVGALLYHELLIAFFALVIYVLSRDKQNQVGLATYIVLWVMRSSSKINLFLGVRNWSAEFLPEHLRYMKSFFKRKAMNWLFPFSVAISLLCLYVLASQAFAPSTTQQAKTGMLLVGSLLALGLLEHLLMVMPFTANALWKWALPAKDNHKAVSHSPPTISSISKEVR